MRRPPRSMRAVVPHRGGDAHAGEDRAGARCDRPGPTRRAPAAARRRADRVRQAGQGDQPRPPRRREERAAVHPRRRRRRHRRSRLGAHRVPQGRRACRPHRRRAGGGSSPARPSRRRLRRDRVLVELWDHGDPLDSARNDALAELAAKRAVGCVATANVHYATPAQRRLATALAAVRARRSLAELDPWLPAAAGAHPRRLGAAAALLPLSGNRRVGRRDRPGGGVRPRPRRPVAATVPVPGRVERDGPPPPRRRALRSRPLRRTPAPRRHDVVAGGRGRRSTASSTSSSSSASPATSSSCGTSSSSAAAPISTAKGAARQPTRRSATPSASPPPTPCRSACCSSASCRPARRPARHRHRHRERSPRGGHPVRLRQARPPPHRPGGQRHHVRACSAIRDMAKALGYAPGQQDAWAKRIDGWGTVATTPPSSRPISTEKTVQNRNRIPVEWDSGAGARARRPGRGRPRHLGIHSGGW